MFLARERVILLEEVVLGTLAHRAAQVTETNTLRRRTNQDGTNRSVKRIAGSLQLINIAGYTNPYHQPTTQTP